MLRTQEGLHAVTRRIDHDGRGTLVVRFRFDRALVDRVKTLPRRRWNALDKVWEVPREDVVAVIDLFAPDRFACSPEVAAMYRDAGGNGAVLETAAGSVAPSGGEPPLLGLPDTPTVDRPPTNGDSFAWDPKPAERAPSTAAEGDAWTVGGLNRAVADLLAGAFPQSIWLVGEVSGWNKQRANRRYFGFELLERDDRSQETAKVAAMLWERDREQIERRLAAAGDPFHLEDEVAVRVKVRVELFERWGLYRVRVEDIDVNWTLGEAARRREEIVRRLTAAGLVDRNSVLPIPDAPLRVGLITSLGSDAYNDVLRTFEESGFAFRVTAHGARVQGPATEPSVLNALDRLHDMADRLDVVLICRGGGSRTDLAWFDTEPLGRAVATFPIPVIVGIGHEQDVSVLDHVARRAKTPTAAAGMVVARVAAAVERIESLGGTIFERSSGLLREARVAAAERGKRLARAARQRLDRGRFELHARQARTVRSARGTIREATRALRRAARAVPRAAQIRLAAAVGGLERSVRQLIQGARRDATEAGRRIAGATVRLGPASHRTLERERERAEGRERRLHLIDPRRVIERGYAILRGPCGVVRRTDQAPEGTPLTADLRDGRLRIRSEGPENGRENDA